MKKSIQLNPFRKNGSLKSKNATPWKKEDKYIAKTIGWI